MNEWTYKSKYQVTFPYFKMYFVMSQEYVVCIFWTGEFRDPLVNSLRSTVVTFWLGLKSNVCLVVHTELLLAAGLKSVSLSKWFCFLLPVVLYTATAFRTLASFLCLAEQLCTLLSDLCPDVICFWVIFSVSFGDVTQCVVTTPENVTGEHWHGISSFLSKDSPISKALEKKHFWYASGSLFMDCLNKYTTLFSCACVKSETRTAKHCSHAMWNRNQPWLTISNIYKGFTNFEEKLLSFLDWKKSHSDNTHPEDAGLPECNTKTTEK